MKVHVRFYWQHDLDLIALAMHPGFDMSDWMRQAFYAYARGDENFYIPVPDPVPYDRVLDSCDVYIFVNERTDRDVAECIRGIRYGHRCSFMKNMFRSYMDRPYFWPYMAEEEYITKSRGRESHYAKDIRSGALRLPDSIAKKSSGRPKADGSTNSDETRKQKKKKDIKVTSESYSRKSDTVKSRGHDVDSSDDSRVSAAESQTGYRKKAVPGTSVKPRHRKDSVDSGGSEPALRENAQKKESGGNIFPEGFDIGAAIDAM